MSKLLSVAFAAMLFNPLVAQAGSTVFGDLFVKPDGVLSTSGSIYADKITDPGGFSGFHLNPKGPEAMGPLLAPYGFGTIAIVVGSNATVFGKLDAKTDVDVGEVLRVQGHIESVEGVAAVGWVTTQTRMVAREFCFPNGDCMSAPPQPASTTTDTRIATLESRIAALERQISLLDTRK